MAGRVNGTGLARERGGRQVSLCRPCPFKAWVLSDLALSTCVFGECAELSLNVSKGTWIFGVLVCCPKDL